jgi:hypothetical protein
MKLAVRSKLVLISAALISCKLPVICFFVKSITLISLTCSLGEFGDIKEFRIASRSILQQGK